MSLIQTSAFTMLIPLIPTLHSRLLLDDTEHHSPAH